MSAPDSPARVPPGVRLARFIARLERPAPPNAEPPAITMTWLRRGRWAAAVGQTATIILARLVFDLELPLSALFSLISITVLSNVALHLWLPRAGARLRRLFQRVLALDTVLLTGLLLLSGGVGNPFSTFYLVHVAMAAVALGRAAAWRTVALCTAGLVTLFVIPHFRGHPLHIPHDLHLSGMVVATVLAAVAIAFFAGHLHRALQDRERELGRLRLAEVQRERFAALATLAAGVAHELGSPLGTISVAAHELTLLAEQRSDAALSADAVLIRAETERCRTLLGRLNARSTAELGEPPVECDVAAIFQAVQAVLAPAHQTRARFSPAARGALLLPKIAIAEALASLIRNACDAAEGVVEIDSALAGSRIVFRVRDQGGPLSSAVQAHVGEPFFTTKEPGRGMGLGLYLVRLLAERLGGEFRLANVGAGTVATLALPPRVELPQV